MTHKYLYLFLFLIFLLPVQAQDTNPDLQRELTIEKEYTPELHDADKINRLPEVKEPEAPKTKVEFSDYTLDYLISPYFQKLGVTNYFPDFATSNKRGYLTAGVSTLLNIDGDVGYQILQSATNRLSIFGSHRSSNSNVTHIERDEKRRMKINDNVLGVDFSHRFKKAILSVDAGYTYSAFNYYGFPAIPQIDPEAEKLPQSFLLPRQINNLLKMGVGIASAEGQKLNYRLNAGYTLLKRKHQQYDLGRPESRILLDGDIHTRINATIGVGFAGGIKDYSHEEWSNYTTLNLNPYLTFEGDKWDARLGVKAGIQAGDVKNFVLSPDIRFHWRPTDPILFYLNVDGGIKDNSFYTIFYENRYVDPYYRVRDSKSPFDGTLGIVFSPLIGLSIDLFTGYKWVKNEHFYYVDTHFVNYLLFEPTRERSIVRQNIVPIYANAEVFKLGGLVKYHYKNVFDLSLKLVYNQWDVTKIDKINFYLFSEPIAWNKPIFTGDGNMGFKIPSIPLRVDLAYHLETGRKALSLWWSPEIVSMKDIHDVSLAATYTINKSLSVYAKANNLLFQKYDLWYGYPAQGFNVMAGVNWKF